MLKQHGLEQGFSLQTASLQATGSSGNLREFAALRRTAATRVRASDGNDSIASATSLGSFPGTRTVRDAVSSSDSDFFSIVLTQASNIRLSLRNLAKSQISGVILSDQGLPVLSKGKQLSVRLKPSQSTESLFKNIQPGSYILRLTSSGANSPYRLKISVVNKPADIVLPCGCQGD